MAARHVGVKIRSVWVADIVVPDVSLLRLFLKIRASLDLVIEWWLKMTGQGLRLVTKGHVDSDLMLPSIGSDD